MSLVKIIAEPAAERPVLVHALAGFLDAGATGRIAISHMIETLDCRLIAEFDIDHLYDYRGRRPRATFLSDHYGEIDLPELKLFELTDTQGQGFLVLQGPEPDMGWKTVRDTLLELIERWDVELIVSVQGVPFPAPHTRPVQITAHGNDPDLIAGREPWVGDIEIPGSLTGLLEISLNAAERKAMGFVAHVPHYLTGADYPSAAVRVIEELSATTGLMIPLDDLRTRAEEADAEIGRQVSADPENAQVVTALERQLDGLLAARAAENAETPADLPTADEIAAQVERFLADLDR